jgi:hypothetical protein
MSDRLNSDDMIVPQLVDLSVTTTACGTSVLAWARVKCNTWLVIRGYT